MVEPIEKNDLQDLKEKVPGIYKAVDQASLDRLISNYSEEVAKSRKRGKEFLKHKEDYLLLSQRLTTLSDKVSHQVVIPFTKKAFMPGRLVHTNEIMVLLGDNWFVERSAKQAREICERRLKSCNESLEMIEKEIGLYESWLRESSQLGATSSDGEGQLDLCEPYDEEELKQWRIQHKENVRKHREKIRKGDEQLCDEPGNDQEKTDEDYWKILDQREVEEELDEYLIQQNDDDQDVQSNSESSESSDDDQDDSDDEEDFQKDDLSSKPKRKVSFGEVIKYDHVTECKNTIIFDHSKEASSVATSSPDPSQLTPGDLYLIYGKDVTANVPKSILKPSNYETCEEENYDDIFFSDPVIPKPEYAEPAVGDVVFERGPTLDPPVPMAEPLPKKQSLFKQNRARK